MKRFPSFTFLLTILQQYSWPVNLLPFSRRKWRVSGMNPFCFLLPNLQINWADIQPHLLFFIHKTKDEFSILDLLIYLDPMLTSFTSSKSCYFITIDLSLSLTFRILLDRALHSLSQWQYYFPVLEDLYLASCLLLFLLQLVSLLFF